MKYNNIHFLLISAFFWSISCESQNTQKRAKTNVLVGGPCETCELIYEGTPEHMSNKDTSDAWNSENQKLQISGIIYDTKQKPAAGVILYYWHTNENGLYKRTNTENHRHGHLRGWVKTGTDGSYSISTIYPNPYPSQTESSHIHLLIKEPDLNNEYYIDAIVFDHDILLTKEVRNAADNFGGTGIVHLDRSGKIWTGKRDIYLGMNIKDYPQ